MTKQLSYKEGVINYQVFGNGEELLFCFHGYGEESFSFLFLENHLEKKYTVYAFDAPLHGQTKWNSNFFSPEELMEILEILNPEKKRVSLLAYSMGGRQALHLLQIWADKFQKILLVAPDGLHLNFWYWLGTQTSIGKKLFKATMQNPSWIFGLMKIADKTGLLNKSLINFSRKFLESKKERELLGKRWIMMNRFRPTHKGILKALKNWDGKLSIIFGRHDRIILSKRSKFLSNKKNVEIKIIDAGHNLLKEKYASDIAGFLL